jgi:hypothetical protein
LECLPFNLRFFNRTELQKEDPLEWAKIADEVKQNYLTLTEDCGIEPTDLMGDVINKRTVENDFVVRQYLNHCNRDQQKIAALTVKEYCEIQNNIFLKQSFIQSNRLWGNDSGLALVSILWKWRSRYISTPTEKISEWTVTEALAFFEKVGVAHKTTSTIIPIFRKHMQTCLAEVHDILPNVKAVSENAFFFEDFCIPFSVL